MILALIFLTTTLSVLAVAYLFMRRWIAQGRLQHALGELIEASIADVGAEAHAAAAPNLIFSIAQKAFHRSGQLILPKEHWEQSMLKTQLIRAGFRRDDAPAIYQGVRVVLSVLLPSLFLLSQFIIGVDSTRVMMISLALTGTGFYLPTLYLRLRTSGRQKRIAKALPNALDMMVVCVEAGLGLDGAIRRVGDEMQLAAPEISEELQLMSLELRAGKSRVDALKNIGHRTGVDEVKAWAALLIQTDRFGTSVANALRVHADGMRIKRRQRLEEQAAKAAVKLIFPLIFFIFPAIMVVTVGPAIIQIVEVLFPAMSGGRQ
jgi:tight adherence protein C